MKKKLLLITMAISIVMTACGSENLETTDNADSNSIEITDDDGSDADMELSEDAVADGSEDITGDGDDENANESTIGDLSSEIKAKVEGIQASGCTLQEELEQVESLEAAYTDIAAETQMEMNMVASYGTEVWDAELNGLWKRMSNELDATTKEKVLKEQREWNEIKEKAAKGMTTMYEGGSIQPMIYAQELANINKNRCYVLASIYAKKLGQSVKIPARKEYGAYIDNQGTGDVYSELYIYEGQESGSAFADIGIYKLTTFHGDVTKTSDGYDFEDQEGRVKGKITYSNEGASFEVTESAAGLANVGDKYEFPWAF